MTVGKFKRSPWPNIASLGSIIICSQIEVGGGGLCIDCVLDCVGFIAVFNTFYYSADMYCVMFILRFPVLIRAKRNPSSQVVW